MNTINISNITQKMDTPEPNKVDNDSNLNDIISQIKKENEDLLSQLQQQKAINAELTSNINNDFKSVGSIDDTSTTNKDKNGTSTNGKSLNEIVVSQEKMIKELTNQIKVNTSKFTKKIKELEV